MNRSFCSDFESAATLKQNGLTREMKAASYCSPCGYSWFLFLHTVVYRLSELLMGSLY